MDKDKLAEMLRWLHDHYNDHGAAEAVLQDLLIYLIELPAEVD